MAKRSAISFAKPKAKGPSSDDARLDRLEQGLSATETRTVANEDPKPKKAQRSRKGLVSTSIWASKEARLELKIHAQKSDTTMEQYILDAINEKLEKDGVDFRIG